VKEKILVIQTAFLGDCVLTLPMIQKLKDKFPDSEITILCIPATKELFGHSAFIDYVIEYDKKGGQKSFGSFIKLLKVIRERGFTRIYSPHRSLRSALIVFFSKAASTTGFDTSDFSFIYKTVVKYNKDKHEVARNLDLIGFDTSDEKWKVFPKIDIPDITGSKIKKMMSELGNPQLAVIAPGSVWNTKIYPEDHFKKVINYLVEKKYLVALIGGKNDEQICRRIEEQFDSGVKSYAGLLSIVESVALLKKSRLLISNDSAPTHLGMIAEIPVLTIYCSTVPEFGFYPYNSKSRFVSLEGLKCKPCGIHGHAKCPIKTFECAFDLSPDIVMASVEKLMASLEK